MRVIGKGEEGRDDAPDATPGTGPAEWLARRGVASLRFDFPLHGDRHNPSIHRLDAVQPHRQPGRNDLVRGGDGLTLFTAPSGGADPERPARRRRPRRRDVARFNPERLTGMGQSMGSTIGVTGRRSTPASKRSCCRAPRSMAEVDDAVEPFDVKACCKPSSARQTIERNHPLLRVQNVWDMVDPVTKANRLIAEPFDSIPAKRVLMPAGIIDGYFSPRAEAAPVASRCRSSVRSRTLHSRVAALVGTEATSYPVKGNINGKTGAVIQKLEHQGHYVLFPNMRFQYTCF